MRKNPLKMLWLAAAFLCLGIGAVGVILPILPTTPFLKTKLCILLPASAMLMCAFFMMSNLPGRIFILLLILFKYVYFFTKIKTIRIEAA